MAKSSFGFNRPEDSPGFLLWQTTVIWQRQIKKALNPYGITHSQFVIMAVSLWFAEDKSIIPTQIDIVDKTKLDKMTVSKALQQLVEKGFVKRIESQFDARAKLIKLTAQGKRLIQKVVPVVESVDRELLGSVETNADEVKILLNAAALERFR